MIAACVAGVVFAGYHALRASMNLNGQPQIGVWVATLTLHGKPCQDVYEFHKTGHMLQFSGARSSEWNYGAEQWDKHGLQWKFLGGIVKESGGADCFGDRVRDAGWTYKAVMQFSPDLQTLQFCDMQGKQCSVAYHKTGMPTDDQ